MNKTIRSFGIALCALTLACGGDGGNGDGGSGGTAGAGGAGGTAGGAGTGGSTGSTVVGIVSNRSGMGGAVSGATVAVFGTSLSTTTNASGEFILENVPDGDRFFVTSAEGNWGTVDYWVVPDETQQGVDLGVISDADIASIGMTLGRVVDPADGALDILFYEGASGGETGAVSASSDPAFTFDLQGAPVEQPGVIAGSAGDGELVYTGIATADGPVTANVSGVSGVTDCFVNEAPGTTYPILAKAITIAYAFCEPAQ